MMEISRRFGYTESKDMFKHYEYLIFGGRQWHNISKIFKKNLARYVSGILFTGTFCNSLHSNNSKVPVDNLKTSGRIFYKYFIRYPGHLSAAQSKLP